MKTFLPQVIKAGKEYFLSKPYLERWKNKANLFREKSLEFIGLDADRKNNY